jgi:hypothetical protein
MIDVERSRVVDADPVEVWNLLADFGEIARWAPNVDHSCLLTGEQPGDDLTGVTRRIQVGRTTLIERVIVSEPAAMLAYRIEGLPPVLRSVVNEWRLQPGGHDDDVYTVVTLTTHVDAGPRPPQQLVAKLAGRRFAGASEQMLDGLTRYAELHSGDSEVGA